MEFLSDPVFGVGLTIVPYMSFYLLSRKYSQINPLVCTTAFIIAFLLLLDIPYSKYQVGGDLITFMLGPATVALGVPIYREAKNIRNNLPPILLGNLGGSIVGIISAGLLVYLMGGGDELIFSMMPKSVTTPISIRIVESLGGFPSLGATFTVLTGMLGSVAGPSFLRRCGVDTDLAMGAAMGTSSHGIGTARSIAESNLQGSISAFSMGAAGIITSILFIPIYYYINTVC